PRTTGSHARAWAWTRPSPDMRSGPGRDCSNRSKQCRRTSARRVGSGESMRPGPITAADGSDPRPISVLLSSSPPTGSRPGWPWPWGWRSATTGPWASPPAPTTPRRGTPTTTSNPGSRCARRTRTGSRRSCPATDGSSPSATARSTSVPACWTPPRSSDPPESPMSSSPRWKCGVLLIGDSGGMVNPFNGEGIDYALESARLAAEVISTYSRYPRAVMRRRLQEYPALLGDSLGGYFTLGRVFASIIGHPALMQFGIKYGMGVDVVMEFVV